MFLAFTAAALLAIPASANAATTIYSSSDGAGQTGAVSVGAGGGLTPLAGSPIASGIDSSGSASTPDNRHLYVPAGAVNGIRGYDVNANGTFTPIAGEPFGSSGDNRAVAISADGRFLIAVLEALEIYSIGPSGALTFVDGFGLGGFGGGIAAVTPDTRFVYVSNPTTGLVGLSIGGDGSLSPIAVPDPGNIPFGLSVSPDGQFLFVGRAASNAISGYRIGADGSLTLVNTVAGTGSAGQIAVAPNGRSLYATNSGGGSVTGWSIAGDGTLSALPNSPYLAGGETGGVSVTPDSRRVYFSQLSNGPNNVAGFAAAADGSLTALAGSPFQAGTFPVLLNAMSVAPDQPPVASFTAAPGAPGAPTSFDASGTTDPDGTVARYDWDFGDGSTANDAGPTPSHTYAAAGDYTVTLTVTDDQGCSTAATFSFTGQVVSCNGGAGARTQRTVTISSTPPPGELGLTIEGEKTQPVDAIEFEATCSLDCDLATEAKLFITPANRLRKGGKPRRWRPLDSPSSALAAGDPATLPVTLEGRKFSAAKRAIRRGGKAKVVLRGDATGPAGQTAFAKASSKLG